MENGSIQKHFSPIFSLMPPSGSFVDMSINICINCSNTVCLCVCLTVKAEAKALIKKFFGGLTRCEREADWKLLKAPAGADVSDEKGAT